jgi:hypothetical protein
MNIVFKEQVVVKFLENVEWLGQDLKEQVHWCTESELADQLAVLADANSLDVTRKDCVFFASRMREITRKPNA